MERQAAYYVANPEEASVKQLEAGGRMARGWGVWGRMRRGVVGDGGVKGGGCGGVGVEGAGGSGRRRGEGVVAKRGVGTSCGGRNCERAGDEGMGHDGGRG